MDSITEIEFDPQEVLKIIQSALKDHVTLTATFVETQMYEQLSFLLSKYMSEADITWMLGEIRENFYSGFTKLTSPEFYGIIQNCRKCPIQVVDTPGQASVWNTEDPDLMIVVDTPATLHQYGNDIARHLKAAGFTSARCNLTYYVRCFPKAQDYKAAIKNCIPYLHTEIAMLSPKLILPLGMTAYTCITGIKPNAFKEVKGDIMWFGPFAILPESSYGSMAYSKTKTAEEIDQYFTSVYNKAHSFIYG